MKYLAIILALALTGCGSMGEPLFLAAIYDRADGCQRQNNHGNYPSYCGAGSNRTNIYANRAWAPIGNQVGYIK